MRYAAAAAFLALLAITGCVDAPSVVQGTVQSFDPEAKRLVLVDTDHGGELVELGTATAEVGAAPNPGDVVRVAYFERDGGRVATRVMNVTSQAGMRDSGGH